MSDSSSNKLNGWRHRLHEIIFEADTPAGRNFDVALILAIVLSVLAVVLESVPSIRKFWGYELYLLEWIFTIVFTIEYVLRLICIGRPLRYATSFFGIIDLLAVLPSYLDLLLPGTHFLFVIRILRLLRIFRVLKLVKFVNESEALWHAMKQSRRKILVFLFAVTAITVIMGSVMYVIEGEEHGFSSIPLGIYWAIVTMTTVGYGDLSPQTPLGKFVSSLLMICGYAIIAVPTGIVTSQLVHGHEKISTQACPQCASEGHRYDAKFCRDCGSAL